MPSSAPPKLGDTRFGPGLRLSAATMVGLGALVIVLATSPLAAGKGAGGACSRAAAREVIREHPHLHPFAPLFTAAGPVLCGPFLGEGEAMIVSFKAATCGGTFGWAAFRRRGGNWDLAWHYPDGQRTIAAAGADIEETLNILRPTDPRCIPTGGTKSRLWHWNGQKFVAGPWRFHYLNPEQFRSPDGTITCYLSESEASCFARGRSGAQHSARLKSNGALATCDVETPSLREVCFQNWNIGLPVLELGQQSVLFGFSCLAAADGITCTKLDAPGKGKGFLVNEGEAVAVTE